MSPAETQALGATAVFQGLRVVELCQGMAGPMAGQLFADNGADVIKIEPPQGDSARSMPGFVMWNRGKSGIVLDLSHGDGRQQGLQLLAGADVLIDSVRGGLGQALGVEADELLAMFPRLVLCTITGFGLAEGFDYLPAYEGIVAAKSGRWLGADHLSGLATSNDGDRPIFSISPIGSYASACLAYVGIVGALRSRLISNRGTRVRTSLLDGIAAATMRMRFRRDGDRVVPVTDTKSSDLVFMGIYLSFMTVECADGRYIQMCARQPDHYQRWLRAIGLADLLDDGRFADGPTGFRDMKDVVELDGRIRRAMKQKTQAEWMALFTGKFDIGADPFLTSSEFMECPDMVANDRVVDIEDPIVGHTKQVGPLALLGTSPRTIGRPAPRLGEHQTRLARLTATGALDSSNPVDAPTTLAPPPFQGVTILETAYYIAGPFGSAILAELGARVIKVEPLTGDTFRGVGVEFALVSHGKESVAIDLKRPESREILDRLLATSDLLLHSFRPGVPDRLGLGYSRVHSLNPALVYVYAGSYGSQGPQARRPGFHSTPQALSGAGIVQAGQGNEPVDDSYPDPCAAIGVAVAMATGVYAKEKTGAGQYIETTMLAATGYVQSDMLVQYAGRPPVAVPDQGQHGANALYRLYECVDGWLMLAAIKEEEWTALAISVGHPEWVSDERFQTVEARARNDGILVAELVNVFKQKAASDWERFLSSQGAPAVRADAQEFELFFVANTPHTPMTHPHFGDYWRRAPAVRIEACAQVAATPAPMLGEHTSSVLGELGYSESEIQALIDAGVVRSGEGRLAKRD